LSNPETTPTQFQPPPRRDPERLSRRLRLREVAAEDASKHLARYVDPLGPANPPRLLRYVLEDDPDTQALESQLGLIGRTRRLFQTVDDIVRKERAKSPHERADDVPDRVIIYIDDLDRCSEDQVYNVLQSIHLLLAFELFVVVVGVDIARVRTALAKFAEGLGQKAEDEKSQQKLAAQYLDKIFQIAFWLSPLTTGDDGSYARYVDWLATPTSEDGEASQTARHASSGDVNAPGSARPSGTETTATPSAEATVDELPPSDPALRGLMTITLEPKEVKFLASDAIGRLAATTPRSVKRLVNCYRLVRTRLGETGVSIMGTAEAPPTYPLIAFMVALETGQTAEIANDFYRGLGALAPTDSLNEASIFSALEAAPSSVQPLANTVSAFEAVRNALAEIVKVRGGNLSVEELQRIARITRRFSFNQPI